MTSSEVKKKPCCVNCHFLMWIPFETTTFRDGILIGTLHSAPLFRIANTLGLV